jgi:hypothetical protein
MPKLIVTHQNPDLDAIASTWLLHRFGGGEYAAAPVAFVAAGSRIEPAQAAQFGVGEKDIVHVDTGMGEYDHHQPERAKQPNVCATTLVLDWLGTWQHDKRDNSPLRILVEYVNQIDHFEECYWPEAENFRYEFMLPNLIVGYRLQSEKDDSGLLRFGELLLDSAYAKIRQEVRALEIIQEKGQSFSFGQWRGLAIASSSNSVEKRAQKMGYELVVRKDEAQGSVRIKATPHSGIDLTKVYEHILEVDRVGTWFLHGSERMLLNGSSKNSTQIPTPLSLTQVVKIIQEVLA